MTGVSLPARHLDDDIWEVRVAGDRVIYRILFATKGAYLTDEILPTILAELEDELMAEPDFLDRMIAKRTVANPDFPGLMAAAVRRRMLLRALAERREAQQRSQTAVAAEMATSQSSVARLETTATDAKISTIERYADVWATSFSIT